MQYYLHVTAYSFITFHIPMHLLPPKISFSPQFPNVFLSLALQVCQLERFSETSGLGISLEARAGHHYLCSVLPEGPVGQSDKIFTGDEIMEVSLILLPVSVSVQLFVIYSSDESATSDRQEKHIHHSVKLLLPFELFLQPQNRMIMNCGCEGPKCKHEMGKTMLKQ